MFDTDNTLKSPIYDFKMTNDYQIVCEKYDDYEIINYGNDRSVTHRYRITTPTKRVLKSNLQMDRYLNGHLFTFSPDYHKAREIILQYYEQKATEAREIADKCDDILLHLRTPTIPLFEHTGGENSD